MAFLTRYGTVTDWRWHLSRECAAKVSREVFELAPDEAPHAPCWACVPPAARAEYAEPEQMEMAA